MFLFPTTCKLIKDRGHVLYNFITFKLTLLCRDSNGEISDSLIKKVSYGWRSISSEVIFREKNFFNIRLRKKRKQRILVLEIICLFVTYKKRIWEGPLFIFNKDKWGCVLVRRSITQYHCQRCLRIVKKHITNVTCQECCQDNKKPFIKLTTSLWTKRFGVAKVQCFNIEEGLGWVNSPE